MMMQNPLNGFDLKFVDKGVFRCKKAYIKIFSANNQQLTLIEQGPCSGFHFEQFIPRDFCMGGIEIGYDISCGMDWPIRQRFFHGGSFKNHFIDLNSLVVLISGTTFYPRISIRDGMGQIIKYEP